MPLIAFAAVLGFALLAWLKVGHWPQYSNPDPKDLRWPLLHVAALLSYPVALLSVPVGLLLTLLGWDSLRRRDIVVFTLGASLWAFNLPVARQLLEWLLD